MMKIGSTLKSAFLPNQKKYTTTKRGDREVRVFYPELFQLIFFFVHQPTTHHAHRTTNQN